jgi:hypothetical protein
MFGSIGVCVCMCLDASDAKEKGFPGAFYLRQHKHTRDNILFFLYFCFRREYQCRMFPECTCLGSASAEDENRHVGSNVYLKTCRTLCPSNCTTFSAQFWRSFAWCESTLYRFAHRPRERKRHCHEHCICMPRSQYLEKVTFGAATQGYHFHTRFVRVCEPFLSVVICRILQNSTFYHETFDTSHTDFTATPCGPRSIAFPGTHRDCTSRFESNVKIRDIRPRSCWWN